MQFILMAIIHNNTFAIRSVEQVKIDDNISFDWFEKKGKIHYK